MTFLLADAKARLGILPADTTKDVVMQGLLGAALALAENWCDRKFMYAAETETLVHPGGLALSLLRYPIDTTTAPLVTGQSGTVTGWRTNAPAGLLEFDGWAPSLAYTVTYSGGYKVLPPDLELALWAIFDAVWGATPGAGKVGTATAGGVIKSISSPDIGSISFHSPNDSSGSSGGVMGGLIPATALGILDLYRREYC